MKMVDKNLLFIVGFLAFFCYGVFVNLLRSIITPGDSQNCS